MRKNKLIKTEEENIYTCKTKKGETHYYLNFELNNKRYQRKNITKLFDVKTLKAAKIRLGAIVTMIEEGEDPFSSTIRMETVKDIVINQIENKQPNYKGKDNSAYKTTLEGFYYKYIDDIIGHLKFEKVSVNHINKILKMIKHLSADRQNLLKVLLYNEFEKRFRKKEIQENLLYDINFGSKSKKVKLDIRLNEKLEQVVQKLYTNIINSNYRTKLLLLINLMCARRIGEIHKLKYQDIKINDDGEYYVLAHPLITKTAIYERYPLPKEAVELLPEDIHEVKNSEKRIFMFHKNTIFLNYNKLIEKSKIKFNNNFKITSHDSRNIFISLLVKNGFDSSLADGCLSHSISDSKGVYLDIGYEAKYNLFEDYWKILRNDKIEISKEK